MKDFFILDLRAKENLNQRRTKMSKELIGYADVEVEEDKIVMVDSYSDNSMEYKEEGVFKKVSFPFRMEDLRIIELTPVR